jgi:hypothetical protein
MMTASRELHYRYAISYLLMGLIAATGFGLFNVPDLVGKVEFSLTVTSLVVGVVAIVYTFLTANKQDTQLTNLMAANANISTASESIKVAATELAVQVQTLPSRFDSIDAKLQDLKGAAAGLPEKDRGAEMDTEPTLSDLRKYLVELNYAGMSALYLALRAYRAKIKISEDLLKKAEKYPPFMFVYGLLVGAAGANLVDLIYLEGGLQITRIAQVLETHLEEQLTDIKQSVSKDDPNPVLGRLIGRIDQMFES